ncbi:MAG TPA: HAD family phosphatase [Patescibacteria group bacterium]|nr:HAD family phosphatase [Patescibacteria group bacterium]
MAYKALVFDYFGVVQLDAFQIWLAQNGFKREGGFAQAAQLLNEGKTTMASFVQDIASLAGRPLAEVQTALETNDAVDPKVVALLHELQGRYRVGLLSNANGEFLRRQLSSHSLALLFDVVMASSEIGVAKPDPALFRAMLAQLGTQPEETIYIDDNQAYVGAANALGIVGVLYTNADALRAELVARKV